MTPNNKAEEGDRDDRVDHRLIAEDRLSREDRDDDVRGQTHGGQYEDIDLRMPKKPKEVLPEKRLTPASGFEKARAGIEIAEQHGRSG